MAENTPPQVVCHHDTDTVTVLLPCSMLNLTREEAESLHCQLQNDLIRDVVLAQHGEEIEELVTVADVPLPRSEAWKLSCLLDSIFFTEDDEPDYSPEDEPHQGVHGFDWRIEGF